VTRRAGLATQDLLVAARSGYGWLLASAPRRMLDVGTPQPPGPRAATMTRVLGARHLLQAMATAWAEAAGLPAVPVLLAGAAVDATHAASMLGFAVISRPLRHAALADALLETGFGACGVTAAWRLARALDRAANGGFVGGDAGLATVHYE
jgi:hypothetical protein